MSQHLLNIRLRRKCVHHFQCYEISFFFFFWDKYGWSPEGKRECPFLCNWEHRKRKLKDSLLFPWVGYFQTAITQNPPCFSIVSLIYNYTRDANSPWQNLLNISHPPPPPLPTFNNTTAYRDIDTVLENYENYECIGSRGSGGLRSPEAEVFLAQSMPKTVSLPLSLNHIYIFP